MKKARPRPPTVASQKPANADINADKGLKGITLPPARMAQNLRVGIMQAYKSADFYVGGSLNHQRKEER